MKVLIIDAYDSFVYMLYQRIGELAKGAEIKVVRNDAITIAQIARYAPDFIVLSPGPGHPKDSGFVGILRRFPDTPTLGVCLGHQAIGLAFGGRIGRARSIMHGKVSSIAHDGKTIFKGVANPLRATRYHSLIVEEKNLPRELEVSARSVEDNYIMALRHRKHPVEGVQFHPESVMTAEGKKILGNFLAAYLR
jgi:anthranilate synthase/aminodeoxychorismate synthase-like glutamine amidotransferase